MKASESTLLFPLTFLLLLCPSVPPPLQVVCVDWSELAGRGYVILNTTENLDCVSVSSLLLSFLLLPD